MSAGGSPPRRVSPTCKVCAIYTRKSSDEGLEQSFNSLDAQRKACAAYVLSQASEGWSATPERYDDGGISGSTLERPGLKRLMADIAAGAIDIVVVYKVDRLTRSLLDFAKLVEAFDRAGVEFVSITQSFNTTSSMGRLTLNMLLSFAQFEREVTAERIRDKIAASKAKGIWMGGQARRWWGELRLGRVNVTVLAARQGCSASYLTRMLRLAFLSPKMVEAILAGRQRSGVDVGYLTLRHPPAADWCGQERMMLAITDQSSATPSTSTRSSPT